MNSYLSASAKTSESESHSEIKVASQSACESTSVCKSIQKYTYNSILKIYNYMPVLGKNFESILECFIRNLESNRKVTKMYI